jgi:hypothetical protein
MCGANKCMSESRNVKIVMKGVTLCELSNAKKVTQSTHMYFRFVSYSKISNVKCTFHRANQTGN